VVEYLFVKRGGRLDARDPHLVKRSQHAGDGSCPGWLMDDQLSDHRSYKLIVAMPPTAVQLARQTLEPRQDQPETVGMIEGASALFLDTDQASSFERIDVFPDIAGLNIARYGQPAGVDPGIIANDVQQSRADLREVVGGGDPVDL